MGGSSDGLERRTWGLPDIQEDRDREGDLREPQTSAMKQEQAPQKLTRFKLQDPPWLEGVLPKSCTKLVICNSLFIFLKRGSTL